MKITTSYWTIITIVIFSITNTFGQNFGQLNAEWHYQKYCSSPPWISNCGYFTAKIVRDTIVLGTPSKIMENRDLGSHVPNGNIIIYELGNRVYFYEGGQFKLLYDFTLNSGDTMTFSVPYNWISYDFTCGDVPDTSEFSKVIIDSIKVLNISGQMLKSLYTSPILSLDTSLYYSWNLGQVIERIGSLNGMFGYSTTQCLGGFPGNFRCYSDSMISYKTIPENCDFVTAIIENLAFLEPIIAPNPFNGFFDVYASKIGRLEIFNLNGVKIISQNLLIGNNIVKTPYDLPKGFYLYQIYYSDELVKNGKLLRIE